MSKLYWVCFQSGLEKLTVSSWPHEPPCEDLHKRTAACKQLTVPAKAVSFSRLSHDIGNLRR